MEERGKKQYNTSEVFDGFPGKKKYLSVNVNKQ